MRELSQEVLKSFDFHKIIEKLSKTCSCDLTREWVEQIKPLASSEEIVQSLQEVKECLEMLTFDTHLEFDHLRDLREILKKLSKEKSILRPEELVQILQLSNIASHLKNTVKSLSLDEKYPSLKKYFQKGARFDYKKLKGISAELDSISLIKDLGYDIEKVIMFVFPDDKGKFSKDERPAVYDYLERLIENAFGLKTEPISIMYSSSDKKLSSNTLITIWNELDKIVEDTKKDKKEIIVDVAPGQKYPGIMAADRKSVV